MGSSLFLQGGTVLAKTLSESHTQSAHGFIIGDVIRWDVAQGKWIKAQANSAQNAEVAGVVSAVNSSSDFTLTYSGYISLTGVPGVSFPALFLSDSTAGGLTGSPPSAIGSVVKPVAIRSSNGNGHLVVNYLGTQIGGSSTVSIDQIQPVGTVIPFAGTVIPDTWLSCNGASYAIADYAELYDKLLNTAAPRAPMHGHVVTLTGTAISANIAVTDIVQFKSNAATAWTSSGIYDSNADITGVVLSVTTTTAVVQTLPRYNSTTKTFSHPNAVFGAGTGTNTLTGTSAYRFLTAAGAIRSGGNAITISTTSITHFNSPDLRGRFALGVNASAISDADGDPAYNSAITGSYSLGSFGGQEGTLAGTGVASGTNAYVTSGTLNSLISNVPPYVAVQYIIKAKPYTRAAIIGGVDPDYPNLLVRDLRSRIMGGSNGDLVFHTNTSGDSGTGTERMRITTDGNVGIGTISPTSNLYIESKVAVTSASTSGLTLASFACNNSDASDFRPRLHITATKEGIVLNESYNTTATNLMFAIGNVERMRLNTTGLGIGLNSPAYRLHVQTDGQQQGQIAFGSSSLGGLAILGHDLNGDAWFYETANRNLRIGTNNTERMRITSVGNVGIGTSAPTAVLDVQGATGNGPGLFVNLNGSDVSTQATSLATMWTRSTVHFKMTGTSTTRLLFGGIDGGHAGIQSSNASGGAALNLAIQPYGGNVGISVDPDSTYKLKVQGKIYASDDIVAFSDARYKRDISPITDSMNKVRSLVGVLYTDANGTRKTGLLAQDVQAVLPEAVTTDEAGNLALAYGNLVGLLVQAVKELSKRVEELEKR